MNLVLSIKNFQKGNKDSFNEVFEMLYPRIFKFVSFRVPSQEVEDIVSDIFLKIIEKIDLFRIPKKITENNFERLFFTWTYQISKNTIIDFYRKNKNDYSLEKITHDSDNFIDSQIPSPEKQTDNFLNNQKLKNLLNELPAIYRDVLELKFFKEFSNEEISTIIGKSKGNIRIIQLRGLQKVRQAFR